jgi:hypothetical protein
LIASHISIALSLFVFSSSLELPRHRYRILWAGQQEAREATEMGKRRSRQLGKENVSADGQAEGSGGFVGHQGD